MKQYSSSNHTKQYLRDFLELAKQRMLSRISTNPTNPTNETNVTSSQLSSSSSPHAIEQVLMNANISEIVLDVGYVLIIGYFLIIIAFIVKRLLKTLRQFEYHFGSSHDGGAYNRFGFIANEYSESDSESDSDYSDSSDNDSHDNNVDDDDVVESSSSSPVSLRHALIPLVTPLQKITTVTPHTPFPPPVRRSLRLKIKSELNLTALEKQNKTNVLTNVVTRSQTRRRNQSHITNEYLAISSEPAPSSSFNLSHDGSVTNPSLQNHEELAYYLQRCYERNMKKRSDVNSPLLVRRLVL
jgi:hypothetical protein